MLVSSKSKGLRVVFGQDKTECVANGDGFDLSLKIPVFGSKNLEIVEIGQPSRVISDADFSLIETELGLLGALVKEITFPLIGATYDIYSKFLRITQGWNLYRIWHHVPYINVHTEGLENYRAFCQGRSLAFEEFYGNGFELKLPAASALGIADNKLALYFLAGREQAIHIENPEQIPAFSYPKQYGPRSPSFARGTLTYQNGRKVGYISGTASIKQHRSVALSRIEEQLHTTIDNISLVCEQMGLGAARMSYANPLPHGSGYTRFFKIYIRDADQFDAIREIFENMVWAADDDEIIYLHADVCRSELDVEIEAVISERRDD